MKKRLEQSLIFIDIVKVIYINYIRCRIIHTSSTTLREEKEGNGSFGSEK